MEKSDPYQPAINYWRGHSVSLLPPATDSEIDRTFSGLGIQVSNDVRRLYSTVNGLGDYESDNLWSLWSLERIASENRDRQSEIIWFADWLISSHMYGIRYYDENKSGIYIDHNSSEHPPEQIACSMIEFLQQYANNPEDVEAWIVQ